MKPYLLSLFLLFATLPSAFAWTVDDLPNPTAQGSYVSNPDQLLSTEQELALKNRLSQIEQKTTNEVSIVVVKTIGDEVPKTFAVSLFNKWGIGKAGKDNGLLILMVMDQRRIEFEVGYGLEGTLTDIQSSRIIQENMIPRMKTGDTFGALALALSEVENVFGSPTESLLDSAIHQAQHNGLQFKTMDGDQMLKLMPFVVLFIFVFIVLSLILKNILINLTFKSMALFVLSIGVLGTCVFLFGSFIQSDMTTKATIFFLAVNLGNLFFLLKKRQFEVSKFIHGKLSYLPQSDKWSIIFFVTTAVLYGWRLTLAMKRKKIKAAGYELLKEEDENLHLSPAQDLEEKIGAAEYDVYVNEKDKQVHVEKNVMPLGKYNTCPSCSTISEELKQTVTLSSATYISSGEGVRIFECLFCGVERKERFVIPKRTQSSSSGGGGSRSSGGSSFGGGRSGGGGAGGSW